MANTFTLIASYASTGSVGSISFTSIPQTYTDLQILYSFRSNDAGVYNDVSITLNGNNSTGAKDLYAINGTAVGSYSPTAAQSFFAEAVGSGATANTFSNGSVYIPNYAGSNNKSISADTVGENNAASSVLLLGAGSYSSAAVTSVTFTPAPSSTFLTNCTAYLYGIKNS